jgi:hypothetical protein
MYAHVYLHVHAHTHTHTHTHGTVKVADELGEGIENTQYNSEHDGKKWKHEKRTEANYI